MINVVLEGNDCRIVVLDSVAHVDDSCKGDIIVCGSHGGESAAVYLLKFRPRGAIFNDAGMGKSNAGIEGLDIFDALFLPAAAVDAFSARIGKGSETYEEGIISVANKAAQSCGVVAGMTARAAAIKMFSSINVEVKVETGAHERSGINHQATGRNRL